jgi:hypothetical protein
LREDARLRGAGSHQRRSRRRDKRGFSIPPILGSTPQGLPGLENESPIRIGHADRRAFWGACAVNADIARVGEIEWGSIWRMLGLAANPVKP